MKCLNTVSYSVILNEGLSSSIRFAEVYHDISCVEICRRAPVISHPFFAGDSLLFTASRPGEVTKVKNILQAYEAASGQCMNYAKSEMSFSSNVSNSISNQLHNVLEMKTVDKHDKKLGRARMVAR